MSTVYKVRAPDGTIVKVRGPEGATPEQVMAQAKRLYTPGAAPAAPGAGAPQVPATLAPPQASAAPAAPVDSLPGAIQDTLGEMSGTEKFFAGMGGAFTGMGIGARQLAAGAMGDEQWKEQLRQEAEEHKRFTNPLGDTGAGFTGELAGNIAAAAIPGGVAGGAARLGLPALMAAEGAAGAGMGALAPTTQEGERAENVALGGVLGGAIPAAGAGIRKLVGQADPAMQQAAKVLEKYGVKIPKADQSPGAISEASKYVMEKAPLLADWSKGRADLKNDKVRDALFKMLGSETPATNEAMTGIVQNLGSQIGAASMGKRIPVEELAPQIKDVMKAYKNLLPSQRNPQILKYGGQLMELSKVPGAKLKGEAYQAIRSDMATEAATAAPAHAKALRGMMKVLDDQFGEQLSEAEASALKKTKEQYRLAKALAKVDIKEGAMSMAKARAAVERAAKRGAVMPEARELLNAADLAIPKISSGGGIPGIAATAGAVLAPVGALKALTLGAGARGVLNTGLPQKAAASRTARGLTAKALRGLNQEMIDED